MWYSFYITVNQLSRININVWVILARSPISHELQIWAALSFHSILSYFLSYSKEMLEKDITKIDLFTLLSFGELNNSNNLQNLDMSEMCSLLIPVPRSRCQSYQICDLVLNSAAAPSPITYGIFASFYHLLHILNCKITEYTRSQGISWPHIPQLFSPNIALMAKFYLGFTMKT